MSNKEQSKAATSTQAITPLPSFGTRVNVNDIKPDDPFITTWFTALEKLKSIPDFSNQMSYFRLAAIHGAPYVGWDGVGSDGPLAANGNFCTHGQNTFPTWHRIYMILFETALYNQISDASFRMPYWDWAENDAGAATPLPLLLSSSTWPVQSTSENPLWRFVNPKQVIDHYDDKGNPVYVTCTFGDVTMYPYNIPNDYPINWAITTATSRCVDPTSSDFITGNNNMNNLMTNLLNAGWYNLDATKDKPPYATISDYVYLLFTWPYKDYNSFATTSYDPVPDSSGSFGWTSLEYLHNNLHNWIGGPASNQVGHMNDVPVAAFDPIFWLHHGFIDGLFAMWQQVHPDLWLNDSSATEPLEPFHKDANGTLFTSNDVRNISAWNYNYSSFPTKATSKKDLFKLINTKYGNNMQHVVGNAAMKNVKGHQNDYLLNVLYDRHALDTAYKIHFFLGEIQANVADVDQTSHSGYIGSVYTFSNGGRGSCANCIEQKAKNKLSRAQVLLTVPLVYHQRDRRLKHLDVDGDDGVAAYLKKNLTWRVVDQNGANVPIKDNPKMKDLKIILVQGTAEHFPDDSTKLSEYHPETYKTFWQGALPHEESEAPEKFVIKHAQ